MEIKNITSLGKYSEIDMDVSWGTRRLRIINTNEILRGWPAIRFEDDDAWVQFVMEVRELNDMLEQGKIRVVKFKYKDYNNIEIFDSVLDAAKSVNDSSTNISRVCKNNSKVSIPRYLCKRYCFMYENDFGDNELEAFDSDGNLICQDADSLYDYIEQYKL